MPDASDEELIRQYLAATPGPAADRLVGELFERYHSRVALWCLRITGDRNSAADLAQDVFLKAFRSLDSFRADAKFSTWLYSIARNHCFNESKARSGRAEQPIEPLFPVLLDPQPGPHEAVERADTTEAMATLVRDALTETEARVMALHFGEELPLDVVTRLLKLENTSGAKAYIVSARRKLAGVVQRWQTRQAREGKR